MSVDAITQLVNAEKQAEELLTKAKEQIQLEQEASRKKMTEFKEQQLEQEQLRKQELRQKYADEWEAIKSPIVEQTEMEIKQMQNIPAETRSKAQHLIMDKVVNLYGD